MSNTLTLSHDDIARSAHLPWGINAILALGFAGIGGLIAWINYQHGTAVIEMLHLTEKVVAVRLLTLAVVIGAAIWLMFGAALLPREKFNRVAVVMSILAVLTNVFESGNLWAARQSIAFAGKAASDGRTARAKELQKLIDDERATAASYRGNADQQSKSVFADSRSSGQQSLRLADSATTRAAAYSRELQELSVNTAPAEADIWGDWMPWKSAAEALLLLIDLISWHVAGLLGRHAWAGRIAARIQDAIADHKAHNTPLPDWVSKRIDPKTLAALLLASGVAAQAQAAPAPTPPSFANDAQATLLREARPVIHWTRAPVFSMQTAQRKVGSEASEAVLPKKEAETASKNEEKPEAHNTGAKKEVETAFGLARPELDQGAPALVSASKVDPGSKPAPLLPEASVAVKQDVSRIDAKAKSKTPRRAPRTVPVYEEVREAVRSGRVKPSTPALKAAFGGSTPTIKDWQKRMEADGIATKTAAGYVATEVTA